MRGYGESSKPSGVHNYWLPTLSGDVKELIQALGVLLFYSSILRTYSLWRTSAKTFWLHMIPLVGGMTPLGFNTRVLSILSDATSV